MNRAGRRQESQVRDESTASDPKECGQTGACGTIMRAERKKNRSKSESRDRRTNDLEPTRSFNGAVLNHNTIRRNEQESGYKKIEEESSHSVGHPSMSPTEGEGSSTSGESGGSLLCPLAPRWLAGHARRRRRRTDHEQPGGWTVTVAGSCRAALPADVEMRLRFPRRESREARPNPAPASHAYPASVHQECRCRRWVDCACSAPSERAAVPPPLPAAPAHHHAHLTHLARPDGRLTLTLKKEARDSSILASKSTRKSTEPLPDLETYKSSRTKTKSCMKTRRGYSLHCWLPEDEPAPIRASNGLSVLGCAIIPELKPRVPTMSERDLTRLYTPRHYLRS